MSYRVLLVGGGSGGHVYPLIAVAKALRETGQQQGINIELLLMGEKGFIERAGEENQIPVKAIMAGKLRRYLSIETFSDLFKFPVGFLQAFWYLFWYMPDTVFSKGGYDSLPVAIVAKIYMIPVYIHESDSVPGLANKIVGRFAKKIFISFSRAAIYFKNKETVLVGNPVRAELQGGDRNLAFQQFGLSPDVKTILVIGGSQGAKIINDAILSGLVLFLENYQIIHQCGERNLTLVQSETQKLLEEGEGKYAGLVKNRYRAYPFLNQNEMALAYAAADVVISRAGSGSIFEIAALGKPAIIIPLVGAASDHQRLNAEEFAKYGAAVIEETNLAPHILISQINHLLGSENYQTISSQIKSFAVPDSAIKIAQAILNK